MRDYKRRSPDVAAQGSSGAAVLLNEYGREESDVNRDHYRMRAQRIETPPTGGVILQFVMDRTPRKSFSDDATFGQRKAAAERRRCCIGCKGKVSVRRRPRASSFESPAEAEGGAIQTMPDDTELGIERSSP